MNHEMTTFSNLEFGDIRVVMVEETPWFVGRDIAQALGYGAGKSGINAVAKHVDEEDKGVTELMTPGGRQKAVVINESGLYAMVFSSRLNSAKRFKHWVTSEVLPSIRKHGVYMTETLLEQVQREPEVILQMAEQLLAERKKSDSLQLQLKSAMPKVHYFDAFVDTGETTNIRNTAKELEIPQNQFVAYLLKHQILYRDSRGILLPYAEYTKNGWFVIRDFYPMAGTVLQQTLFTSKGKEMIRRRILRDQKKES